MKHTKICKTCKLVKKENEFRISKRKYKRADGTVRKYIYKDVTCISCRLKAQSESNKQNKYVKEKELKYGVNTSKYKHLDQLDVGYKYCSHCNDLKKIDEFYSKARVCKECRSNNYLQPKRKILAQRTQKWRQENPEKARALNEKWAKQNPEKIKEMRKKAYKKHRVRIRNYMRKYHVEWRKECKDSYLVVLLRQQIKGDIKPEDIPRELYELKKQIVLAKRRLKEREKL